MFARSILLVVFAILLSACETIPGVPGYVSEKKADFDGSLEISAAPAFVYRKAEKFSGSDLRLSVFWTSSMDPGYFIVAAHVDGAESIQQKASLQFNIDGNIVSLDALDPITQIRITPGSPSIGIRPQNESSQRYRMTESLFKNIMNGKDVKVRLNMQRAYVAGDFSFANTSSAKASFARFYESYLNTKSSMK